MNFVPPTAPEILALYEELGGKQLVYITSKRITHSDLDEQQSRLRLPKSSQSAIQNLLPLNQQAAANFLSKLERDSMMGIFLTNEDARSAIELAGVNIEVFVFSPGEPGRQGQGKLKQWNCGAIVVHGMNAVRAWSHLHEGDIVQVWGFKDEENRLFLAIHKL